jgi:hypothetical protein
MLLFFPVLYFHPISIFAQTTPPTTYEVLEFNAVSGPSSLIKIIIGWAFKLAGVFAFAMIVFAGFEYTISGGDTSKQKDAQTKIIGAIVGIILLFAFYIILYTINPDILISSPTTSSSSTTTTTTTTTEEEQTTGLVNIRGYEFPPVLSPGLDDYKNGVFLNGGLADDLSNITKNETYAPFVVTDACVTNTLPCKTTQIDPPRPSNDCHNYGTCVDIDSTTGDNKTLITIFNAAGLNVLDEGGWLHIASPEATGPGSYANSGCKTNPCEITINGVKAYWYKAT